MQWTALIGALLLVLAAASRHVKRLPMSTATIYLGLGYAIGPQGLGWVRLDLTHGAVWFERLTEVAVIVALFIGGVKLRLPWRDSVWFPAYRLALPVMFACIASMALVSHLSLGLSPALSLLMAAALAPTDPVLAGSVTVSDAADRDRVRYGLSGEAGLNDGMAFPFIVLGLEWLRRGNLGEWLLGWAAWRLLWAVPAALVLGFWLGKTVGRWIMRLRADHRDSAAPNDFLALALIALSYVAAEVIFVWGFLAVFAAGVGLRAAELRVVADSPHPAAGNEPDVVHPPAEHLVAAHEKSHALAEPAVAAGVVVADTISFGTTAERLLEVVLVTVVGVVIGQYWSVHAFGLALLLFVVVRPLWTHVFLIKTFTSSRQRWLIGWFGIRGIGTLYYVAYALNHGLEGAAAETVLSIALTVVAASILLHGISATPLLAYHRKRPLEVANPPV